ncbi:DUF6056 family protein [Larkinella rosea]|uniref:Glycosyltransferase RgtA/B/C/D-like domain-containing protein n=1 Tax=Larkinella rosea TaxID=2025312 RepID=A0A3P1BVE9_9BACT|nr:DUF6056 family protein [Larkinella rosea]RRB04846.1 hypothetical protein EHT25_15405 [Larkinella rosea]
MNQLVTPNKFVFLLIIGFFLLAAFPLIALSFYNQPSLVDDFCFADTARKFGVWQAQQFYYDGWTGRYFHNLMVHTGPLVWEWYNAYTVFPILLLLLLWLGFYYVLRQLAQLVLTQTELVISATAATFLFISQLVSLPEFFFWYPGLACYSVSCVCFLFLVGVLVAHDRIQFRLSAAFLLVESLLVAVIIGSSETSMIMAMALLGTVLFGLLIYRRKLPVSLLILFAIACICCFYLIKAPGNAVRMGGNKQSQDILFSLTATFRYCLIYFPKQFIQTPLVPISLLFLPIAYRLTDPHNPSRRYFDIHPLLAVGPYVGLLFVLTMLHFWAVGVQPVPRLLNSVNLILTVGWFYNLTVWVRAVRQTGSGFSFLTHYQWIVVGAVAVALVFVTYRNPNLRLAYNDLRSGKAREYHDAVDKRYALMASSPSDVVELGPLPANPYSLVLGDLNVDSGSLWNRCWASYYHKKGVRLTAPSEVELRNTPH